jgi:uncharacterized membrane protein
MRESVTLNGQWIRLLLLGSLCLNVLFGAFVATRMLHEAKSPDTALPPPLIEFAAKHLPPSDAEILRRVYRVHEKEFSARQAEYVEALRASGRFIAEPGMEMNAVRKAVMEATHIRTEIGNLAVQTFLEALPQLSPEGRQALTVPNHR